MMFIIFMPYLLRAFFVLYHMLLQLMIEFIYEYMRYF